MRGPPSYRGSASFLRPRPDLARLGPSGHQPITACNPTVARNGSLLAFREIIANALIHRDLDDWSQAFAVEVRLRRDRLVVTNPGGLYGITVDRLGNDAVTSARNGLLVGICQHVRSASSGGRVVEALASGIPTITQALSNHGLPPAQFIDANIRFTVLLRSAASTLYSAPTFGTTELRVYDALASGPQTVAELQTTLSLTGPTIRKALRSLRNRGLVHQNGGRGRPTTYRQATTTAR